MTESEKTPARSPESVQLDEAAIAELRQAALDYQKEAIAYKTEQKQ